MFDTAPYYLVLLLAAIPALTDKIKKPGLGWIGFFILLLIFVGFRYEVGGDWYGYLIIADEWRNAEFSELYGRAESGFYFLVWLSDHLGLDIYGANVITTAIFLYGVFKYCGKQLNPWLAIFTSLPFLVIVIGMSANRQAAAIGITLLALADWKESAIVKKIILICFAALFHTSAIVFLVFVVADSRMSIVRKIAASTLVLVIAVFIFHPDESISRYQSSYIDARDINVSYGALQQLLLNVLPALVFLFMSMRSQSFRMKVPLWNVIMVMSIMSIILVPMSFMYSTAAARISFYLFPISISFFASLPEMFDVSTKYIVKSFVVFYGFLVLGLWLNFANTAFRHIPYNNVLIHFA